MSDCVLKRVAAGEPGALKACMNQYGGLVWTLARRMSPTIADAEDAVQEVFVAIWENAGRYDPQLGSETTFVAMIARRRLIDRTRKASRRPTSAALIEEAAPDNSLAPPGARGETNEEAKRAEEVLRQLSPEQQRVLRLAVYHGMSHDRIARSTDLPLGTVKTHIRRGLIRVRELLAEQAGTPAPDRSAGSSASAAGGER